MSTVLRPGLAYYQGKGKVAFEKIIDSRGLIHAQKGILDAYVGRDYVTRVAMVRDMGMANKKP